VNRRLLAARGLALAVGLLIPVCGGVAAQSCLTGQVSGSGWAAVHVGRTNSADALYAAEVVWQVQPSWSVSFIGEELDFGEGTPPRRSAALEFAVRLPAVQLACVTGGVSRARVGELQMTTLPVGIRLGLDLAGAQSVWRVIPFVEPRTAFRRTSIAGFHDDSAASSLEAGILIGRDRFFADVRYEKVFAYNESSALRVRLGATF
jgi:hypothetical protein